MKGLIKSAAIAGYGLIKRDIGSKIFYYHDVHTENAWTSMSTPLELFNIHFEILQREGFRIVQEIRSPKHEAMITFDDGWRGIYENFDFFIDKKIPVTIFVIAGRIGKPGYLDKKEIEELIQTGLVKIGSHTCSHKNLDEQTDKIRYDEMASSKKRLENLFGITVEWLCYPRGRFNETIVMEATDIGYKLQFSCLPGRADKTIYGHVVRRNFVQHANAMEFRGWLFDGGKIMHDRFRRQHERPFS